MPRVNQKNVTWFKVRKKTKKKETKARHFPVWWRIYLTQDRQLARQEFVLHSDSSLVLDQKVPAEESRRSTKGQKQSAFYEVIIYKIGDTKRALIDRFNKLTPVFPCVCPFIDHKFRHNIFKVAVDPQTALTMLWWNSLSITRQKH